MTTLEKIRAEIAKIEPLDYPCDKREPEHIRDMALEIIDKYAEQEPTKEEQALLQKWRDNRGISIEDFEDAMNALQEPCDDVRRQAVLDLIDKFIIPIPTMGGRDLNAETNSHLRQVKRNVEQLPSVRPQEQTGHWDKSCRCSECGEWSILETEKWSGKYKFCPNCGCRMVEPQESEESE